MNAIWALVAGLLIAGLLVWYEPALLAESATPPQPVHASFDVPGVAFSK